MMLFSILSPTLQDSGKDWAQKRWTSPQGDQSLERMTNLVGKRENHGSNTNTEEEEKPQRRTVPRRKTSLRGGKWVSGRQNKFQARRTHFLYPSHRKSLQIIHIISRQFHIKKFFFLFRNLSHVHRGRIVSPIPNVWMVKVKCILHEERSLFIKNTNKTK